MRDWFGELFPEVGKVVREHADAMGVSVEDGDNPEEGSGDMPRGRRAAVKAELQQTELTPEQKLAIKEERFKRLAGGRTDKILALFENLGACANTTGYAYSDDQVKRIFAALDDALERCKRKFIDRQAKGHKQKFQL